MTSSELATWRSRFGTAAWDRLVAAQLAATEASRAAASVPTSAIFVALRSANHDVVEAAATLKQGPPCPVPSAEVHVHRWAALALESGQVVVNARLAPDRSIGAATLDLSAHLREKSRRELQLAAAEIGALEPA